MTPLLDIHRVSKRFQGTQALKDVDFSVIGGEVHALMGENGAGKSTLSKIIAGVVSPDSGEITWPSSWALAWSSRSWISFPI